MSNRQSFSKEFRSIAVSAVVDEDRRVVDVATEMEVRPGTLSNWVSRHRRDNPEEEKPLSLSERARLAELEQENLLLHNKCEFLGKAAAFFAREYR